MKMNMRGRGVSFYFTANHKLQQHNFLHSFAFLISEHVMFSAHYFQLSHFHTSSFMSTMNIPIDTSWLGYLIAFYVIFCIYVIEYVYQLSFNLQQAMNNY
jgi:hypothetical protein